MPRKNGFEVLEWLQSQPFENMVVVVLSGSEQREDVTKAMNLANRARIGVDIRLYSKPIDEVQVADALLAVVAGSKVT